MAESEAKAGKRASELSEEVKRITDQLVRLALFETAKKFNLPLDQNAFSAFPKSEQVKNIETKLYGLTITTGLHHVDIGWSLKMEAVQERITSHTIMRRQPEWGFFGLVKERPVLASGIRSVEDVRANADISATEDGKLSLALPVGVAHSALFFVMFDSLDAFVLDENVTAMIQRPPAPTLDDIPVLREKLRALVKEEDRSSSPEENETARFKEAANKVAEYRRELVSQGYAEEDVNRLSSGLEERLDQILFK